MNLILTMAGKYERFKLFGNKVPKYLMPLGKTTVLWHVINEIRLSCPNLNIYLLANDTDRDFQPIIGAILEDFSIKKSNLAYIADTASQLETAFSINREYDGMLSSSEEKISFTNIDTILKSRINFFNKLTKIKVNEGLVDTFMGSSLEYSYIRSCSDDNIETIVDNSRISEYACSGLYSFGSCKFFCDQAGDFLNKNLKGNFTDFYNYLISKDFSVFYNINEDHQNTIVLGTPEEYIQNIHKF